MGVGLSVIENILALNLTPTKRIRLSLGLSVIANILDIPTSMIINKIKIKSIFLFLNGSNLKLNP